MKELILELAKYVAPSGTEPGIQEALLNHVRAEADEVLVDALGNGIARKNGKGPHVLLAAHADEPGVMVIHIEENGFLRIISIGDLRANTLVGRHVRFTNGVTGVVGVEGKVKVQDVTFDDLYVDIGADSQAQAAARLYIGDAGVCWEPVVALDESRLAGRALDNRVGCAIAIEAFKRLAKDGYRISLAFTAQQVVGARGAKTVAFRLQPDLAIVVDAAPAGDMPKADRVELKIGYGPAVKIMDGTAVVPLDVKDLLIASAQTAGIDIQYEVWPRGQTDAGAIQLSVDGISVGGVSYPARYVGSPSTVIDTRDAERAVAWIIAAVQAKASK